ncbi:MULTISPECIES: hypothetical protein [unclassified Candidatus Frackibacter]|uniref:hypothetical protein n=1 Tax=unclassified Candidatus Frackibacter TaxID=2648818 RepID=UPI000B7D4919|nr:MULTISPECIES: hypothetical protein [unclassified Candidatus Frackibacter]
MNQKWKRDILVYSVLYVLLYIISLSQFSYEFFLVLFFSLIIYGLLKHKIVELFLPFMVLQLVFPSLNSKEKLFNWFTMNVFGVSPIHILTIVIFLRFIFVTIKSKKIIVNNLMIFVIVLLIFQVSIGIFNIKIFFYRYLVDILMLFTTIVYYGYVLSQTEDNILKIYEQLTLFPYAIVWGGLFTHYFFNAPLYITIAPYVAGVLILNSFMRTTYFGRKFKKFSIFTLFVYLINKIFNQIGSMMIIIIIMLLIIIIIKKLLELISFKKIDFISLFMIILILFVGSSLTYNLINEGNVVLKMKVEQITSIFKFNPYNMRHSTAVRFLEFMNTYADMLNNNKLLLLFGKGAGGYFSDTYYPFPYFGQDDYSNTQIILRKFHTPHNSINYIFLKNGFLGLLFITVVIFKCFRGLLSNNSNDYYISLVLMLIISTIMGFGIKVSIVLGLFLGLFAKRKIIVVDQL